MATPSGEQFQLAAHDQRLVVVEVGGGIRRYARAGVDLIDGYSEDEMATGARGQILAPWPNRLQDGRYEWAGQEYQVALTEPDHANAIHGLVRWASWRRTDASQNRLRVEHRLHPQAGWPWTVDLAVEYELTPSGLQVRTTATNLDPDPCPFGLGWHPYLRAFGGVVDDLTLTIPAVDAYESDERGLPTERVAVEGTPLDFRVGKKVGAAQIDTAYTGLIRDGDGRSAVDLLGPAGHGTRLWLDSHYTHLMIFTGDTLTEPGRRRRALAVEPMTGAPNMLRSGDGRLVLERGQPFEAVWGLDVFSLG